MACTCAGLERCDTNHKHTTLFIIVDLILIINVSRCMFVFTSLVANIVYKIYCSKIECTIIYQSPFF